MTTGKAKPYYATQELHDTLKRIGNGNQSRGLQIAGGFHGRLVKALDKLSREYAEKGSDGVDNLEYDSSRALLTEIAEAGK